MAGHPMAAFFEKAVADKMNSRKGSKQGGAPGFHKGGSGMDATGKKGAVRPFGLHPTNTKKLSAKRGTTR